MNCVNKNKILLVDSNVIHAAAESKKLLKNGYEVRFAYSGEEAIELVKNQNTGIDIILMDIDLGPGLNGFETSGKILEQKEIPIIFLTDSKDQDLVKKIKSVTRYGYVIKGSEEHVLTLAIEIAAELFHSNKKIESIETKFKNITKLMNEIFWLRDINSKSLIYVSPTCEKIWGRTCQSFYDNPDSFMDVIHHEDRDSVKKIYEDMEKRPLTLEYKYRIVRDDGKIRWIKARINPVFDKNGKLFRYAGISEDITSLKKAEDELVEMKKQLKETFEQAREFAVAAEAANIAKNQFLANMSHEIRTPLNSIIGITSLLLDSEPNADQKKFLEIMQESGDNLLTLINQILDLSEIETCNFEFNMSNFDIREEMHDIIEMFALKAFTKTLAFNFKFDDRVPNKLRGNLKRLRQIVINLLHNAVKFANDGGIDVFVSVVDENEKSVILKFEINDTGIGIPEKYINILFTPFTQIDGGMNRRYGGTGLGLAVCKKIVKLMGGEIGVKRNDNNGSLFWFTVDLQKQNDAKISMNEIDKTDRIHNDKRSETILLVEDNKTSQKVTNAILKKLGYKIDFAINGYECIDALKMKEYSLVLMDCQMPDKDGFQTTMEIRSGKAGVINQDTLIIALTANAMNGDRERCIKAGMNDYISKPVKIGELDKLLKRWGVSVASLNN